MKYVHIYNIYILIEIESHCEAPMRQLQWFDIFLQVEPGEI